MSEKLKILSVSDLHRDSRLFSLLSLAVDEHRPDIVAVVGDFLDATGISEGKLELEECAKKLSVLPCPEVVFVRGNHEDSALWNFAEYWKQSGKDFNLIEGGAFVYGPLIIIGFPCLSNRGDGLFENVPTDPNKWLPKLVRQYGPPARTLWLMHEPPYSTPLSEEDGELSGHIEWLEAIERYSPLLVVFGHDHNTPIRTKKWHHRFSVPTHLVNVGQTVRGPLHYTIIDMEFPDSRESIPKSITVTAYPQKETLELPLKR